ncbi:polyphosphate kinase 2 [Bradyrhizobium sp. LB9.1b]
MAKDEPAERMKRKDYEKQLEKLQIELCQLQDFVREKKLRVIVLFEGRDAAGKGGTIKAITEKVSPRVFRVVALPAPSDREKTQIFFQRYMQQFPAGGEIVIFDRSWYNRAGVEYVMGFCTPTDHDRFLTLCPELEKYIVDGGIILIKIWLEVGMDEQERRFHARIDDPVRQWKLSHDGSGILRALVRLFEGARPHAQEDEHETRAMVHHPLRRQAPGAAELHRTSVEGDPAQADQEG